VTTREERWIEVDQVEGLARKHPHDVEAVTEEQPTPALREQLGDLPKPLGPCLHHLDELKGKFDTGVMMLEATFPVVAERFLGNGNMAEAGRDLEESLLFRERDRVGGDWFCDLAGPVGVGVLAVRCHG
jgi:hypothetical protein